MAEIVELKGVEHVVGFAIPKPRDAILYFIGALDDKDAAPVVQRFATKEQLHQATFGKPLESDSTMRGRQIQAWAYALHCLEDWCVEHKVPYVSFPLEDRGTGKSDHYYGITTNRDILDVCEKYVEKRRKQYVIACNSKLSRIEKAKKLRQLKADQESNLRQILKIIKANKKANQNEEDHTEPENH